MKIVMPERETLTKGDVDTSVFEEFGELVLVDHTDREAIVRELQDADIFIINKVIADAELLQGAKQLKYIGECATGYNNIDLNYCDAHGITVCNAPAYSTDAVAQHVFALLLEHCSQVHAYNNFVQEGEWIRAKQFSCFVYDQTELSGKTMGLIGFGRIGQKVAGIAKAFGMRVLAYSRTNCLGLEPGEHREGSLAEFVPLDDLLAESDVVSIHCPLNEESEKLFGDETFAKMKEGAYLINTARGPIIDEEALAAALNSGLLSGAALDVLEQEPMREDSPLLHIENCLITPHVAWAPRETRERLVDITVSNLTAYLSGSPVNVVNHPGTSDQD